MLRDGKYLCDGRHYGGDYDDEGDLVEALPEAPYWRECAWCGAVIDLCVDCRGRKFTCDRCFDDKARFGVEEARRRAKRRERDRERKRRLRGRILRARPGERLLWSREEVMGL
jgi:hypothetical protein